MAFELGRCSVRKYSGIVLAAVATCQSSAKIRPVAYTLAKPPAWVGLPCQGGYEPIYWVTIAVVIRPAADTR